MLLKLMPEAVSRQWDFLSIQIAKSLPEDERSETTLNNVLAGILQNQIQCWISYDSQNYNSVNAVMLLTPLEDPFKQEKNLLIYAITRVEKMERELTERMYMEGFQALKKFMQKYGFSKLIGHTDEQNEKLVQTAKWLGAKLRWHITIDMTGG